jgi:hypothetical protein
MAPKKRQCGFFFRRLGSYKSMKYDPFALRPRLLAAAVAVVMAACGGGGGGSDNDQGAGGNPPNPPAGGTSVLAGGWSGTAAPGEIAQVFVTADGTAWAFAMNANNAPLDMYVGALVASGGQVSSPGMTAFDYDERTATDAGVTEGTYVVGSQLAFKITAQGATAGVPIAVNSVPASNYDPTPAAKLADVGGAWNGHFTASETGGVFVNPTTGAITTSTSEGCLSSGTLTPRQNENVFDVDVTLVATGTCLTPNAVATGTAFVVGSAPNARLFIGLKTKDSTQGATFTGTR